MCAAVSLLSQWGSLTDALSTWLPFRIKIKLMKQLRSWGSQVEFAVAELYMSILLFLTLSTESEGQDLNFTL